MYFPLLCAFIFFFTPFAEDGVAVPALVTKCHAMSYKVTASKFGMVFANSKSVPNLLKKIFHLLSKNFSVRNVGTGFALFNYRAGPKDRTVLLSLLKK
jgi:hypothetical protein